MISYIIIMAIALAIVLPILIMILNAIDKDMRKKKRSYYSTSKHLRLRFINNSYNFFSKLPLTRTYMNRLRIIYEVSYPADEERIKHKTMILAYGIWGICVAEIVVILLVYNSYTGFINASIIVIYTANELKNMVINKEEYKFLRQFDDFLSTMRHLYYSDPFVDNAIIEAGEMAGYEMALHAKQIEKVITSSGNTDNENLAEEYNESIHNNYLKMFVSLCQNVMEQGDIIRNKTSIFLQNLSDMRNEVNLEMRNMSENNYMFQALTFVAMVPILFLYPIRIWAISNLSELDSFYNGRVGILIGIFLYLLTITCYTLVSSLKLTKYADAKEHKILEKISNVPFVKEIINVSMRKNYTKYERRQDFLERIGESITAKQLHVKQILFFCVTFFASISMLICLHINEKRYVMNNVREEVATTATSKDNDILTETILQYANEYKNEVISELEIEEILNNASLFSNELTRTEVAQEIFSKISTYQNEYFKWYEVLVALALAFLGYQIPYWLVLYRVKILEMTMETEVIEFQNIIIALMYMPSISPKNILEQMEIFAIVFKKSLRKCINNYSNGEREALEVLKEEEKFGPFRNLVDNFISIDDIGIERAFEEVFTDRENSRERRKQETYFTRQNRVLYATVLAFVPVIAVLALYLIGPFLIECYRMWQTYRTQMNGMMS